MLQQMMDDCRGEGLDPVICSSWRSREKQEALIANKEYRLIQAGVPEKDAAAEAAKTVAVPGTSEHELGWRWILWTAVIRSWRRNRRIRRYRDG